MPPALLFWSPPARVELGDGGKSPLWAPGLPSVPALPFLHRAKPSNIATLWGFHKWNTRMLLGNPRSSADLCSSFTFPAPPSSLTEHFSHSGFLSQNLQWHIPLFAGLLWVLKGANPDSPELSVGRGSFKNKMLWVWLGLILQICGNKNAVSVAWADIFMWE